jgi:hypothetical protein
VRSQNYRLSKLFKANRLCDVAAEASVAGALDIFGLTEPSQRNSVNALQATNALHDLAPTAVGQPNIRYQQIELLRLGERNRLGFGRCGSNTMTESREQASQNVEGGLVIFDEQNLQRAQFDCLRWWAHAMRCGCGGAALQRDDEGTPAGNTITPCNDLATMALGD